MSLRRRRSVELGDILHLEVPAEGVVYIALAVRLEGVDGVQLLINRFPTTNKTTLPNPRLWVAWNSVQDLARWSILCAGPR